MAKEIISYYCNGAYDQNDGIFVTYRQIGDTAGQYYSYRVECPELSREGLCHLGEKNDGIFRQCVQIRKLLETRQSVIVEFPYNL